ncbi:MAG: tetratricopeptide repeat protein [Promethearchaeota archaeon]
MGTCALVFIKSKLLCYTHYDSHPFKLGEALSRIKTNWKDILQCCKEYNICNIDAKYWVKDPKLIYECLDDQFQRDCPKLLNPHTIEEFKNGNRKIIEEEFEECLVDWLNEPYTIYFNMTDDYQYNHYDGRVFIRLRYTNFPWVPIEDLGPYYNDEQILDEIFYDMLGILDPSEHIVKPNPDNINLFELMGLQKPPYSFRQTVSDPCFSGSEEVKSLIDKCREGAIASGRHFILACKKATELIPDDPNNWWNYGVSLELQGRLDDAIKMYSKAAEFTPTNPTIWRILGSAHSKLGHNFEAKECLKKAISYLKNFDMSDNYYYIANIEKEITAIEGILTKITNNEEIHDRLYASIIPIYTEFNKWNKVGWAFFKLGKIDDAINSFRNSINEIFDYEFIKPIKNRLIIFKKYLKEISFTEYSPVSKIIVECLKEKLDSHPKDPVLWRLIAENLLDCGKYEEALKACQSCIKNLSDIYNKKAQDEEKNNLIILLKNTKFAYLIPQIENIQTKKKN